MYQIKVQQSLAVAANLFFYGLYLKNNFKKRVFKPIAVLRLIL